MKKQRIGKSKSNENYVVYVVDKKGRPLDPTRRFGHVRRMLKEGKAVVISKNPFTIKLKRVATGPTRDYTLGIDPGRENIGLAVRDDKNRCVFKAEVDTKNRAVTQANTDRRNHRRERRSHRRQKNQRRALRDGNAFKTGKEDKLKNRPCLSREISYPGMEKKVTRKVIRGKEARFNNRKRDKEFITSSGDQLLGSHLNMLTEIEGFLPVSNIVLEMNKFDFQKLENPKISGRAYQEGPLHGYSSEFEYLWDRQGGRCPLCGKEIEEVHHERWRSETGSDRIENKVGLCHDCHDKVHKDPEVRKKLESLIDKSSKTYRVSLLNSVFPELVDRIKDHCRERRISFEMTIGKLTNFKRDYYNLEKSHATDAFLISLGDSLPEIVEPSGHVYQYRRFKKKSDNNIIKVGSRKYYFEGKLIAQNRHKALAQKTDSLEDYRNHYLKTHTQEEWNAHFKELRVEPARRVYSSHKKGVTPEFHPGDMVHFKRVLKSGKVKYEGTGIVKTVKPSQNLVQLTSGQSIDFKYCTYLGGKALVCLQ